MTTQQAHFWTILGFGLMFATILLIAFTPKWLSNFGRKLEDFLSPIWLLVEIVGLCFAIYWFVASATLQIILYAALALVVTGVIIYLLISGIKGRRKV